jgi:hypothetical protein
MFMIFETQPLTHNLKLMMICFSSFFFIDSFDSFSKSVLAVGCKR